VLSVPGVSQPDSLSKGLYLLRLPEFPIQTPFPVRPVDVAAGFLGHALLDDLLRLPVVSLEVSADFYREGDLVELGNVIFWEIPLPRATRHYLGKRYETSWYWHQADRKDKPFSNWRSGKVPTLPPTPVLGHIKAYLRPKDGPVDQRCYLRLEETLLAKRLAALLRRAERTGGRKRLSVMRCLWNLSVATVPVHKRFSPIFRAGLLPWPALPTYDDMQSLRVVLSYATNEEFRRMRQEQAERERELWEVADEESVFADPSSFRL